MALTLVLAIKSLTESTPPTHPHALVHRMLGGQFLINLKVTNQTSQHERKATQGAEEAKHAAEASRVGSDDGIPLTQRLPVVTHLSQYGEVGFGIGGDGGRQVQRGQFGLHDVLEDGAADADADGHAEAAQERVHGGGGALVAGQRDGLRRAVQRVEEQPVPDAEDDQDDNPASCAGVPAPADGHAGRERGQPPARPDGPAETAGAGDGGADDDGGGDQGEHDRQQRDAGPDGRVELDGFQEEGNVVELSVELRGQVSNVGDGEVSRCKH